MIGKSLRIAVFVHEFPALSETFVLDQITGLLDRGHDLTVFAARPRDEAESHPQIETYSLAERTRYVDPVANKLVRILDVLRMLFTVGWRRPRLVFRCLDYRRYGRDALSLRLLHWALRLCGERPFDIVHCHFGLIGQFAAKLRDAGAISGRLTTVFHGVDLSACLVDSPGYYRFLFGNGDLFLPISERWRAKLIELDCDPARIRVHRMGIDTRRYRFHPRQLVTGRPLEILTVGRLIEKKGVEYALMAVGGAVERGLDIRYRIVGDGPLRDGLERLSRTLRLEERVTFLGWRDRDAVSALMQSADILLAPSVTAADGDQEGLPVTLMEAMASGMLVISTQHSGIPELVEHEHSGILAPERDSVALVRALVDLAGNPDLWPEFSTRARAGVTRRHNVDVLNDTLDGLLRGLAETGRGGHYRHDRARKSGNVSIRAARPSAG